MRLVVSSRRVLDSVLSNFAGDPEKGGLRTRSCYEAISLRFRSLQNESSVILLQIESLVTPLANVCFP